MIKFAPKMLRLTKPITQTLSVRISLTVVFAIATLLMAALFIMFHFSRKALKEEAIQKAEQTLEATVQHIDNILLSVEQGAGNIYCDMMIHLNEPERMFDYSRALVESNPNIAGCAIAFTPYYYKEKGEHFMAYVHRTGSGQLQSDNSAIIQAETFGNTPYTEQIWFTKVIETGRPCWINPLKDVNTEGEAIITFSIPIYDHTGKIIGVMGTDVSLDLLSDIVLAAKTSPNSYATMLASDGSYIVHPDDDKIAHHTIFTRLSDSPTALEAGKAMVAGQTGYRQFRMDGTDSYVFYKPFKLSLVPGRSMEDIGWSVGIIYPEDDIFGDYNRLLWVVLAITVIGLLLMLILCQWFAHRQLLPLRLLSQSAQHIAEGYYDEPIPDTRQQDEVGRLQHHFQQMQKALAVNMGKLEQLTNALIDQGIVLADAYEHAKEADRMKTAFLHNMTNQMTEPVGIINKDVDSLCNHCQELKPEEADRKVTDIQRQGHKITELLNQLLTLSQE